MIKGYHHTQISVPTGNAQQVRDFYGSVLGLLELPVPEALAGRGLIWFKVGNRELHVAVEDGFDRSTTRTHLAYEVDDVQEMRNRLTGKFELIEQPKIPGYDRFHLIDPFGNRLEFIGVSP